MTEAVRWLLMVSGGLLWVLLAWFTWDEYVPEWRQRFHELRHRRKLSRVLAHAELLMEAMALMQGQDGPSSVEPGAGAGQREPRP